jgi:small conductance mechanosensitive channel
LGLEPGPAAASAQAGRQAFDAARDDLECGAVRQCQQAPGTDRALGALEDRVEPPLEKPGRRSPSGLVAFVQAPALATIRHQAEPASPRDGISEPHLRMEIPMEEWQETLQNALATYGPSVLGALAVLVIGWWVSKVITSFIRKGMARAEVDATLVGFVCNLTYMGLMVMVVISALGQLGVNTTSFAAVIAAAGLAIGFALQGSLGNFAAGVMLIIFRPFKAGDFVEAGGVAGVVEDIQVFATKIRTGDNKEITVPNGAITGGSIVNYSAKDTRRVDMVFGIGYDDDILQAKRILNEILVADDRILKDPEPMIAVSELADSSVNFVVRPWVSSGDYWPVLFDTTEKVKLEFDKQGVSIPFPQTDVHLHKVDAA